MNVRPFVCAGVSLSGAFPGRVRRPLVLPLVVAGLVISTGNVHASPSVTETVVAPTIEPETASISVLLLPSRRVGVSRVLTRMIDQLLLSELAHAELGRVVSSGDLARLIEQERLKDLLDCDEVRCLSEIGGALDTDWIVTSSLGRMGGRYLFSLRVFSTGDGETLAMVNEALDNEPQLLDAAPRMTRQLLREASGAAPQGPPTFFTAELSASAAGRFGAESYYPGPGTTLRVAWGGLWPPIGWYFYILAGLQMSHLWGEQTSRGGAFSYQRTQLSPFALLRAAIPIAHDGHTRLAFGLGFGGLYEVAGAEQAGGIAVNSEVWKPELRVLAGMSHRLTPLLSLFGNYRLRVQIGGRGVDTVTEVVSLGVSEPTTTVHEIEIGCGFHF